MDSIPSEFPYLSKVRLFRVDQLYYVRVRIFENEGQSTPTAERLQDGLARTLGDVYRDIEGWLRTEFQGPSLALLCSRGFGIVFDDIAKGLAQIGLSLCDRRFEYEPYDVVGALNVQITDGRIVMSCGGE